MSNTLILNATALVGSKLRENTSVLIGDGKLLKIGFNERIPGNTEVLDAKGQYLLPAFIELHAHGGGGFDFADGTQAAFDGIMETHLEHGVTLLCPTLVACSWKKTTEFLAFCDGVPGSSPMFGGVHLEGPFLSPAMCGAQNRCHIIEPTEEQIRQLEAFSPLLSCITAAPEVSGVQMLACRMRAKDVSMSVGHSNADAATMINAAEWGFDRVTHLFCSTSRRAKRGSYVIGGIEEVSLIDPRFTAELIGDGHHISRESLLLTEKCKGTDGMVLVSDAMRAAGCSRLTESYLGEVRPENKVIIEDGVAKLPDRTSFAGSVAVGDTMVQALCGSYGLPLETVAMAMSAVPARLLNLPNRGKLQEGFEAELVLLNKDYKTVKVFSKATRYYNV